MTRCLLVDDDAGIRTLVGDYLQGFGMSVESVCDAAGLRRAFVAGTFDIVLLDLMLPDESGLDLCRWLRKDNPGLPLIMLTAKGDPISRVLGLELGADDYVAKPFEPRELVARIHALLRRTSGPGAAAQPAKVVVHFEGWTLDFEQRQLGSPHDVLMALSNAEFRLLAAFIQHAGRVLSRDQLLELTREPGVDVTDRCVDLGVSRLRHKLGDSPRDAGLIRTVRGAGYCSTPRSARDAAPAAARRYVAAAPVRVDVGGAGREPSGRLPRLPRSDSAAA